VAHHNGDVLITPRRHERVDAKHLRSLVPAIQVSWTLRRLDLSENPQLKLGGAARSLASLIRQSGCSLEDLNLQSCGLGNKGAATLAPALGENHSLTSVDLGSNDITSKGLLSLAEGLRSNQKLACLKLA